MVVNTPKVTKVKFTQDSEDPYSVAENKMERLYALFQMVSPQYWIFSGFPVAEKSESSQFAHSYLCQRLERTTFTGQMWTNFEFGNLRRTSLLNNEQGRRKLLLSGKFRHDIAQDLCHLRSATYSPKYGLSDDYDENHPVYVSEGTWASYEAAKELNLFRFG